MLNLRKKELLNLNAELFEEAKKYKAMYEELKKENAELLSKIENNENEEINIPAETEEPEIKETTFLKTQLIPKITLSEDMEYAASVIGKIIIKADISCSLLKCANPNQPDNDKINLILGKTEVAKADIFDIVNSDSDTNIKKEKIDAYIITIENYINSVLEQKD